jgi:hypothetical protein
MGIYKSPLEIWTVAPQFLFWEYLFQILGIGSLQCIHHLHKVKKGERRGEGDGEINNPIKCSRAVAVAAAKRSRNAHETGQNVSHYHRQRSVGDGEGGPDGGYRVSRSPPVHQSLVEGCPGDVGGKKTS